MHTHMHSNLIIFLVVLQKQALLFHDQLAEGWGGVGWDNSVHVPVHARAQQPHHLCCWPADTGLLNDDDDADYDDDDDEEKEDGKE